MAAPSNTVWGAIATGSKSTRKGRIGISLTVTTSNTQVTVVVQTWFWSMYSVDDSNNSYYYNAASSATTLIGAVDINHTVNTGSGWSTSNQTKLGQSTYTYARGTSAATKYFAAKLTGIDTLYSSSVMTVSTSVTIPALASYTVSYNANGGSGAPSRQTKYYDKTLILSTTKPTRTGYTFVGWATSSTATTATYAAGGSYTANSGTTLYAVWKAHTYTVSYNANGGSGAPSSQTKTYGKTLTLSTIKPTRTYYNFLGWSTSSTATTATYAAGGSYTANSAATLYAVWELAYVKPRITKLSVNRCDVNGNLTSKGTYAKVNFNWSCDLSVTSVKIEWAQSANDEYAYVKSITASGTSGTVSEVVGASNLSPDLPYKFRVTVTDTESAMGFGNIAGSVFVIDGLVGGQGVAFGKKAEEKNLADFAWPIYPEKGFRYPFLERGTDLNNVTSFGVYHANVATTYEYVNCPIASAISFVLEVFPAGDNGQMIQRLTTCNKTGMAIYHRHYYSSTWGDWIKTY